MRWTRDEVVEEDQCKVMTEVSNASEVRELGTERKRDISDSTTMQALQRAKKPGRVLLKGVKYIQNGN